MPKIRVTATFEVTFEHTVTKTQLKELEAETMRLDDIVDETIPYRLAASEGEVEMEWDYNATRSKKKGARK